MASPSSNPGSETILASDAVFKGEIAFEGTLRIDGKFEGKMNSKGRLTVGKGAQVAAEVIVASAAIDGVMKGNIVAGERVELASSAQLLGDVRATRLIVAEGATLVGNCVISPDAMKGDIRGAAERDQLLGTHAPAPQTARR